MKTILAAVAFAIALPAVVHAQAAPAPAPAPAPKKHCCCQDKSKPMACCAEHGGKAGKENHAGHDMGGHRQH
jgi:hypothetical protein